MAFNKLTAFVDCNTDQVINSYKQKIEKVSSEPAYVGTIPIGGEKVKVASTIGRESINDIAAELLVNHSCDIAIIVNPDTNDVHFRKRSSCKINLSNLANKLCEGSGNTNVATGKITDTFLNFTKLLQKI